MLKKTTQENIAHLSLSNFAYSVHKIILLCLQVHENYNIITAPDKRGIQFFFFFFFFSMSTH